MDDRSATKETLVPRSDRGTVLLIIFRPNVLPYSIFTLRPFKLGIMTIPYPNANGCETSKRRPNALRILRNMPAPGSTLPFSIREI